MPPSEHGHDSLGIGQNYVAFSRESAEYGLNRCKDTTFLRFIQMYKPEILCKYQSIESVEPTVEPNCKCKITQFLSKTWVYLIQNRTDKHYDSFNTVLECTSESYSFICG